MKILFSPSETKTTYASKAPIHEKSFIFPKLYQKRLFVLEQYRSLLQEANLSTLQTLFGYKEEEKVIAHAAIDPLKALTCKAIERYSGVAYDHLDFRTLDEISQRFLEENLLIFSNLFGPILAKDLIPVYKVHQGQSLNGFKIEPFYKEAFQDVLHRWLDGEMVIDLRAGFYEKFFTLKQPYITMKFLKNGKNVSHFAKAYRGMVVRALAQHRPSTEEELRNIPFSGLKIKEILLSKYKYEYIFESID